MDNHQNGGDGGGGSVGATAESHGNAADALSARLGEKLKVDQKNCHEGQIDQHMSNGNKVLVNGIQKDDLEKGDVLDREVTAAASLAERRIGARPKQRPRSPPPMESVPQPSPSTTAGTI